MWVLFCSPENAGKMRFCFRLVQKRKYCHTGNKIKMPLLVVFPCTLNLDVGDQSVKTALNLSPI